MGKKGTWRSRIVSALAGGLTLAAAFNSSAALADPPPNARTIYLTGSLTEDVAERIIIRMDELDSASHTAPITLHIMSGGGSVNAAMAIYDHSRAIRAPIATVCAGDASSASFFLLTTVASPHMRKAYPNCRLMEHEISWGGGAKTSDAADRSVEQNQNQHDFYRIISEHTGWSIPALARMFERRDLYMSAQQAKEMGFIDEVLAPVKPLPQVAPRQEYPQWLCRVTGNPRPFCP